jgi:8-oxo-dGTP pyrophosphatase MutT (NUDIX family)
VRDGQVLAEKRKMTRRLAPGAVAPPGGHVGVDRTAVGEYVRLSQSV